MSTIAAYVCYVLRGSSPSSSSTQPTYVGITNNLARRLRQHNGAIKGGARRTRQHQPWALVATVVGFQNKQQALQFEWAVHHIRAPRNSGVAGRLSVVARVMSKQRWTSRAPLSRDVPLSLKLFDESEDAVEAQVSHFRDHVQRALRDDHVVGPLLVVADAHRRRSPPADAGGGALHGALQHGVVHAPSQCREALAP